jgi:exodeoxyribonuclease VII small subunit
MSKKSTAKPDFETSLKELETLVETMEKGELSLEDSLSHFEQGIKLSRSCQQALKEAEQKVEILLKKDDQDDIACFDNDDD